MRYFTDHQPVAELKHLLLTAFKRVRLTTSASAILDDCIGIARR
jgi:hypothetical protein